jgi:hypothetical protein
MRGTVAKRLRKLAGKMCRPEEGKYMDKVERYVYGPGRHEGQHVVQGRLQWMKNSFIAVYRRLKKEYKHG